MHPKYDFGKDSEFLKELYRLEGFVNLRNHEMQVKLQEGVEQNFTEEEKGRNYLLLVAAAECFQKAMGKENNTIKQVINEV